MFLKEGICCTKCSKLLDRLFKFAEARAHCDIPCGIYDPHQAQIGALTVIRMIDLMGDLKAAHARESLEYQNSVARYVLVKEEHAELVKREVRVIFGDYFKKEQVEKFPELPDLMHKIMQFGSKSRQTASREAAMDLLNSVNRFAEIFWATKSIETKRVKAPYKPGEEDRLSGAVILGIIKVSGHSLAPAFGDGDFVLVSKFPLLFFGVRPGDVVVFHHPSLGRLIKLVERVEDGGDRIFVVGLDPYSRDSRVFGALPRVIVLGKVIAHIRKK